jgi:hypothetical protein
MEPVRLEMLEAAVVGHLARRAQLHLLDERAYIAEPAVLPLQGAQYGETRSNRGEVRGAGNLLAGSIVGSC